MRERVFFFSVTPVDGAALGGALVVPFEKLNLGAIRPPAGAQIRGKYGALGRPAAPIQGSIWGKFRHCLNRIIRCCTIKINIVYCNTGGALAQWDIIYNRRALYNIMH